MDLTIASHSKCQKCNNDIFNYDEGGGGGGGGGGECLLHSFR